MRNPPNFPLNPHTLYLIPTAVIMPTMQEGRLLFLCVFFNSGSSEDTNVLS